MKAVLATLIATLAASSGFADLGPGSPAPPLSVKTWYKGAPVAQLEKDQIYVVEFWATWCGPCVESIPHLTETAHKNPDVTFIGVSIWEPDKDGSIRKFVDKMGQKMDYHVGYSGDQDGMAETWMKAAAQNGIPTAFIVKDGTIQWVGHPMAIEKPLAEVKAGAFDIAAFRTEFNKRAAETRKRMALNAEFTAITNLFAQGKRKEAKTKLARIFAANPQLESTVDSIRFKWLAMENPKAWEAEAIKLAQSRKAESIQKLRSFALALSVKPAPDLKTVHRAIELALGSFDKPDPLTLQYAVIVYENLHEYDRSAKLTDRLLAVLPDNEENAKLREAMKEKKSELTSKALAAR